MQEHRRYYALRPNFFNNVPILSSKIFQPAAAVPNLCNLLLKISRRFLRECGIMYSLSVFPALWKFRLRVLTGFLAAIPRPPVFHLSQRKGAEACHLAWEESIPMIETCHST